MKRKQLYYLLGAALVLAIAGGIFQLVRSAGWKGEASDLEPFAKLPVNSVEKLVIKSAKDKVTLQKASDIWTVAERSGYPADFSKIRELMTSLWEFKVVRQLDVGASQFGRLNIVAPGQGDHSGVELDLSDASGKDIKSLIFGKTFGGGESSADEEEAEEPGGNGRFVYDPSEKDKVYLSKENFYTVDASPKNWLDKQFITAEGVKEVARASSPDGDGWNLSKKDQKAAWQLADAKPGETLNPSVVASLGSFSPSFQDVKAANTPDSETGLNKPVIVSVETFDGFKYALEIGGQAPDQSRFFRFKVSADLPSKRTAEPNESPDDKKKKDDAFDKQQETLKTRLASEQKLENWIFEVDSYSLETFLKPRKDLLKEASPTPAVRPAVNTGVLPKAPVPLPLAATPTPAVSPAPVVAPTPEVAPASAIPSPSPESSATPETKPETKPSPEKAPSPEATPSPETKSTPETTPSPEGSATPETTPSPETKSTPEATPSPEAVSSSPGPSATPGT
jgi:Domain of unknown function (DUF4340)